MEAVEAAEAVEALCPAWPVREQQVVGAGKLKL